MKNNFSILSLLISLIFFASCQKIQGEGEITREDRSVPKLSKINSEIGDKVIVTQGGEQKLWISGQQNIIDQIETYVEYGRLTIRYKSGAEIQKHKPVEVHVNVASLQEVVQNGNGYIYLLNQIEAKDLSFIILGPGQIYAEEVYAKNIETEMNGTGRLTITQGATQTETIAMHGASRLDFSNFSADTATIFLSGNGEARLNVKNYLKAEISGSGTIYYAGDPLIDQEIKGSGEIKPQ